MTSKPRTLILILAMGSLLLPPPGAAGATPMVVEPSAPIHHFFDAKNLCLQSISIIAMAADVASTRRALRIPGTRELNPLLRSQGTMLSFKIAGAGAGIGIAYLMHRSGHYKAERMVPVIFAVPSGLAAMHNFSIQR